MIPKFRAWDKNTNDMVDVKTIDLEKDGSIGCIVDYNGINLDMTECVIMQSTGLKDKNGVEIFEGDILKIIEVTNEGISEYITDVIWEDCSFVFKSEGVDYYDSFLGAFSGDPNKTYPLFELLVIGNVWDNPELLEGAE
ncbi:YopX family protein [Enterococcus faecalis]|uniref:YopX family protein n=1 Tax=Enterococcus faecalis TaxID=1351 RepID=UPI001A09E077|nr:YopX family protein [Enterococcus faecalis]EGQ1195558.1 DNA-packaging protein [Listeria monocytogenes]MCE2562316.1 DNA-packaging protein [Enterococcus faecalis]